MKTLRLRYILLGFGRTRQGSGLGSQCEEGFDRDKGHHIEAYDPRIAETLPCVPRFTRLKRQIKAE